MRLGELWRLGVFSARHTRDAIDILLVAIGKSREEIWIERPDEVFDEASRMDERH